jgi:serine/threonine-protein kinase Chk2
MAEQILMGRFDYPSPYWDSVADPALDLIDRMLTVDSEKRITVDGCLEHSWTTGREMMQETQVSIDSTEGLTGAMANMDFSKRKTHRERTLLSTLNEVHVARIVEVKQDEKGHTTQPEVKIFDKNHGQPSITESQQHYNGDNQQQAFDVGTEERINRENLLKEKERKATKTKGKATNKGAKKKAIKERAPDAERTPADFMVMGGKGDQLLFDD